MAQQTRQLTDNDRLDLIEQIDGIIHAMRRANDAGDAIKFDEYQDELQATITMYSD